MEVSIPLRPSNKVLIIGLDGATWDLLDPWAAEGHLPIIEKLRQTGVWGPLRTTLPPITPSCWTSMYTGANPGKHGIFGFSQRRPGSYRLAPTHASARKANTIFRIISDAGMKLGVLNAPATYPPEPVNGLFVPGVPVPDNAADYTHPRELAAELQSLTGGRHMYPPGLREVGGHSDEFLRLCDDYSKSVASATGLMMDRIGDWDFFMVEFQITDTVQHHFWHYLDPQHPMYEPDAPEFLRNAVLDRYRIVDRCLAEILVRAGDQTNVLVVSDHGGAPFHEQLYLNTWLWSQGWLNLKRSPATVLRRLAFTAGFTPEFVRRKVYARAPSAIRKSVESREGTSLALADRFFLSLEDANWERTRAYSYGGPLGSIYVNLKGREPHGCVPIEDYDSVVDELADDLLQMRHPVTGEPIVEKVIRASEIYHGPLTAEGPDLQLLTKDLRYFAAGFLQFPSKRWVGAPWGGWTGHHSLDGMILLAGPDVRAGSGIDGASIMDIAPTVLAMLGQPVPDWMDGKVLTECLSEKFLKGSMPRVVHEDVIPSTAAKSAGYTAEDEAQIAKRLADLGYIE